MNKSISSPASSYRLSASALRRLGWLGLGSIGLALTVVACGGGSDQSIWVQRKAELLNSTMQPPARVASSYSVVNLTSSGWVSTGWGTQINAKGQFVFGDWVDGYQKAYFYDGASVRQFGAGTQILPNSINEAGQVTGWKYEGFSGGAFVWTPTDDSAGSFVDIGVLPGSYLFGSSNGISINNLGQVTGNSTTNGPQFQRAFRWTPTGASGGAMVDLGTLEGHTTSTGISINDAGTVVGISDNRVFAWTPTESDAGKKIDITPPGATYSHYAEINESGHVALAADDGTGTRGFWRNSVVGTSVDIGTLGGGRTYPAAMNSAGQIVGWSTMARGHGRAFIWNPAINGQPAAMVSLGDTLDAMRFVFSMANEINGGGVAVGLVFDSNLEQRAFAWSEADGMVDLNARISNAPEGLVLHQATHISDNGSIIANSSAGWVLLKPKFVSDAAPTIGPISANDPVPAGTPVSVSAAFTDTDIADNHKGSWYWGDSSVADSAAVNQSSGAGSATGTHVFSAAGVYEVVLEVTDSSGRSAKVSRQVVVYDPAAGYVTGGGWIHSPPGAYRQDQMLTGRASFGFVSKYQHGATKPSGNTEFQFRAANLNFHSSNYEWLVVSGARAQYKGSGTINGQGDYKFILTAVDGALLGDGSVDRFRIKIWQHDADSTSEMVVYDNQVDTGSVAISNEGTAVSGGSIVIQRR